VPVISHVFVSRVNLVGYLRRTSDGRHGLGLGRLTIGTGRHLRLGSHPCRIGLRIHPGHIGLCIRPGHIGLCIRPWRIGLCIRP
jgi:hypothetical protein